MLYINWQGTKDGSNVYTLAAPETPVETALNIGSLTTGALSSYGNIRALERSSASYVDAALDPIPAGGVVGYTGYSILLFIDPKTFNSGDASNPPFFELRTGVSGGGDGSLTISRLLASTGNLQCIIGWGSWNSEASFNFAWPSAAFWLWIRADPDNETSSERLKYKTWAWDGSVPGSWTSATASGSAATSGTYLDLDFLRLMHRDSSTQPIGFGPIVISSDPDEDMTAFLPSSAGATLETPTATSITQTTATIGCTSDTAEGLVHAGVTTTATPPSDAQLIAGSGGGIVAAGSVSAVAGANTVGLTGLTADTGYFRHFIQSDGAGTATSTMLSPDETAGFTTLDNVPTITSVTPSTVAASTNPVIAGTNFGATQAGGSVIISPTDDSSDVNAVTQTVSAWADDEITLDGVSFPTGAVHEGTLYLFVFNNDQEVNAAGETIAAYIAPLLTNPTQVNVGSTTVTPRVTTTVGNGTAYHVIFPQSDPDPNKEQIAAGNGADDQPAPFSDSMAVSAAGELTFPEVTGLDPAVAYRIGYTHNGDPNA